MSRTFTKKFSNLSSELRVRVKALSATPNEKSIHDIRTSIRRIEAACDLLPKDLRKKRKVKIYLKCAKALFKATTPVRDLDIVELGLKRFGDSPATQEALLVIRDERPRLVRSFSRYARVLGKKKLPKIKPSQISDSKFSKNRKKVLRKLDSSLSSMLSTILANPSDVKALHALRKECKELRYTLEIGGVSTKKEKGQNRIGQLKSWQDLLGEITDIDAMLNYIAANKFDEPMIDVVSKLRDARKAKLDSFLIISRKFRASLNLERSPATA